MPLLRASRDGREGLREGGRGGGRRGEGRGRESARQYCALVCLADLNVVGAHLMGKDDLMVDVTVRHDLIGDARDVLRHGTLRNPDRPDQLLDLVRLIAEGREVVRRLPVRKEVEQPQKLAVNAPRGRHARRQERQRPIASIRLPVVADLVGLVKEQEKAIYVIKCNASFFSDSLKFAFARRGSAGGISKNLFWTYKCAASHSPGTGPIRKISSKNDFFPERCQAPLFCNGSKR